MTVRPAPRALPLAAVLVVGGVAVAGCDAPHPGAAAVVGDQRISTSSVQRSVEELLALPGGTSLKDSASSGDLQREQLGRQITAVVMDAVARDNGVDVTTGEVESQLASVVQSVGGTTGLQQVMVREHVAQSDLRPTVRMTLLEQRLAAKLAPGRGTDQTGQQQQDAAVNKAFVAEVKRLHVSVNPRYGTFDPSSLRVVQAPGLGEVAAPSR